MLALPRAFILGWSAVSLFAPSRIQIQLNFVVGEGRRKKEKSSKSVKFVVRETPKAKGNFHFAISSALLKSRESPAPSFFDIESFPQGLHHREQDELMKLTSFQLSSRKEFDFDSRAIEAEIVLSTRSLSRDDVIPPSCQQTN